MAHFGRKCVSYHYEVEMTVPGRSEHIIKADFPPFNTGEHTVTNWPNTSNMQFWEYKWKSVEALVPLVSCRLSVFEKDGEARTLVKSEELCPEESPTARRTSKWNAWNEIRVYRTQIFIMRLDVLVGQPDEVPHSTLRAIADSLTKSNFIVVRLYFPHLGRYLFANAEVLKSASPYFRSLLSSGFAEGQLRTGPLEEDEDDEKERLFEDEDDERDEQLPSVERQELVPRGQYHNVVINHFALTTYHAVLLYLNTGQITFAALKSTAEAPADKSKIDEEDQDDAPKLTGPILASCTSVYHLATHLELPTLASLALTEFTKSLSAINVVHQLCSKFAQSTRSWAMRQ